MVRLRTPAHFRFLQFDEIPNVHLRADLVAGAQMRVRPQAHFRPDPRVLQHASVLHQRAIGNLTRMDGGERLNAAVRPDPGAPEQVHEGFDDGVGANLDLGINHAGFRPENGHARGHELGALARPYLGIQLRQFRPVVCPRDFMLIAGLFRQHLGTLAGQDTGDIGQVILAMRIVGTQFVEVLEQRLGGESVDPGIRFADLLLLRRELLLLDDGFDLVRRAPRLFLADNASVAGRVREVGGQNRHGRVILPVKVEDPGDGLGAEQGNVAGEHQHVVVPGQRLARRHDRVPGAKLFRLQHELHAGARHGFAHAFRLVPDDDENILRRQHCLGRLHHVVQQRPSADLVEDLGMSGFQPRALAGRHDGDGEARLGLRLAGRLLARNHGAHLIASD